MRSCNSGDGSNAMAHNSAERSGAKCVNTEGVTAAITGTNGHNYFVLVRYVRVKQTIQNKKHKMALWIRRSICLWTFMAAALLECLNEALIESVGETSHSR